MQSRAYKRGDNDPPRPKPNNEVLAIHSWGKPIYRGSSAIGYITITDRGWGGFTTTGQLVAVTHSEHAARQAVLARGPRECEQ